MKSISDAIIVSMELNTNGNIDEALMVVGRKRKNKSLEIINAIKGAEALDLYKRLTTITNNEE